MRFGEVPSAEAEGAVLAHTLKVGDLALRKGRRLSAEDVRTLAAKGVESVTVARIGPDDVAEDEAAEAVACAVAGPGLTIGNAFTGRVNLHAETAGLLVVDPDRIERFNRIDEAVTLGTLPAFARIEPRQMAATIKIIPFAVPRAVLERCLAVARETGAMLHVAPFRGLRVRLIQTRLSGVKESVLDKTVSVTAARLAAVGARLVGEARVLHALAPLARAVAEAVDGCDLLLVAGASAITDRKDVLPAAIEAAGGRVLHFGMPVDPGNLLLLARRGEVPVLGLPGCARSPKLNGFDWVLQRLAAGIEVTAADITGMGVGGLLTEIPSRPQPREAAERQRPPRVAALVLAAGQSRRMGPRNKLLIEVGGRPMVTRAVDAAGASRAAEVVVVTGHERERVEKALTSRKVRFAHNPDYEQGLSTSLKAGLGALGEEVDGVLVLLGDMPRLESRHLDRLIAAFNPLEGRAICVPTVLGKRGNPVLWGRSFFAAMQALKGDVGARHLIGEHGDLVVEVAMDDEAALLDIDTPEALARLGEVP